MTSRTEETWTIPRPDGIELRGHLAHSGLAGKGAVLYVHGFGSRWLGEKSRALAAHCAQREWTFAAVDLRGHGDSGGTLRHLRAGPLQDDLDAVLGLLAERGVGRTFLVGSSMGGWAGAWLATRRSEAIAACGLIAPALDFIEGFYRRLPPGQQKAWRENGFLPARNIARETDEELDATLLDEAPGYTPGALADCWWTPALIYHGMKDEVIPYQGSVDFLARAEYPDMELRLIRAGDHRLHRIADEMAGAFCEFFARHGMGG